MKKDISIHEFFNIYQSRNDIFLIDVRDKEKFNEYHIPGSVNMPSYLLKKNFKKLTDINKRYFIIDYDNEIANELCDLLDREGFDVCAVYGGIKRWKGNFKWFLLL